MAAVTAALSWKAALALGLPAWAAGPAAAGAGAAAALYVGQRAWHALSQALHGLAAYVADIQAGHPHEVHLKEPGEMGELARRLAELARHFQKTLQEATQRQQELSAVLAGLADGCVAVDGSGRILLFNGAAARLFGVTEAQALGRPLVEVIRSYDLVTAVQEALASGQARVREFRVSQPEERVLQVTVTLLGGSGLAGAVALIRDVTELRRLERVRSDFVANVSHELRTPLTAIKGFIETLQEGGVEESTRQRFLQIMARETDRLVNLINDLLELSRLESRTAELHRSPVQVAQVAGTVVEMFARKAQAKGLRLRADFPPDLPAVWADGDMLRQVFINLLDNAVKYTPRGEVRVRAWVASENSDDAGACTGPRQVVIEVADTGVGIPRQHLGRIFERFYRVDRARSRELGGTGLGLSIVRHIVELHGGRVEVESEVGVGSTFRVWLPAAPGRPLDGSASQRV